MSGSDHARIVPPNVPTARPQVCNPYRPGETSGSSGIKSTQPRFSSWGFAEKKSSSTKNQQFPNTYSTQLVDSKCDPDHVEHAHRAAGQNISFCLMEFSKFIRYGK
jgi:hypothetical protein